jgi:YD repeat-containing protein
MRLRGTWFPLLLFVCASAAFAQEPMEDRGFHPGRVYSVHGIDSVNQFNGNLNVRIPLGKTRSVSDKLSYQFVLTYNSKVWRHHINTNGEVEGTPLQFNAGLGWHLSLGQLSRNGDPDSDMQTGRWTYKSPDGAVHQFYANLHDDGGSALAPTMYTRDGTYLRLRQIDTLDRRREIDFPDGNMHVFERLVPAQGTWALSNDYTGGFWRLTSMRDARGNTATIQYQTTEDHSEVWIVRDNGREARVFFMPSPSTYFLKEVDFVELDSFGGERFRYVFNYESILIPPSVADTASDEEDPPFAVRVLTGVTPKNLAGNEMLGNGYRMLAPNGLPAYETSAQTAGVLTLLTLPTLGRIGWTYVARPFGDGSAPSTIHIPVMVTQRYVCDPVAGGPCGAGVAPTWTYGIVLGDRPWCQAQCPTGPNPGPCVSGKPRQVTAWMLEPAGAGSEPRMTVSYFSSYRWANNPDGDTCPVNGAIEREYGLPFTRKATLGGLFLSTEVRHGFLPADFEAWQNSPTPNTGAMPDTGGRVRERTYVEYELDAEGAADFNPRIRRTATYYPDDTGCNGAVCAKKTNHYDFDGYGHYRQASTDDNFGGTANYRTSFVKYTPSESNWLLNTASESCTADEASARTTAVGTCAGLPNALVSRMSYDAYGDLVAKRTLEAAGVQLSQSDLLMRRAYDAKGTLVEETSYGGDLNLLPDHQGPYTSASVFDVPSTFDYRVTHIPTYYAGGALDTMVSAYSNSVVVRNEKYDETSGLLWKTKDPADIETTFLYDALGRVTSETTPNVAPTTYSYAEAIWNPQYYPARAFSLQQTSNEGMVAKEFHYDGQGRLFREYTRVPAAGSVWSGVQTTYDAAGHVWKVSMPQVVTLGNPFVPSYQTVSSNFDWTGAAQQLTGPDGSFTGSVRTGVRQVERTSLVKTPGTFTHPVTVTETYDSKGRLIALTDLSGAPSTESPDGTPATTAYTYDAADRLRTVTMGGANPPQTRTFVYDNRGFLQSETHPELGVNGNGTTSYPQYDARGHVRRKQTGPTTLQFTYDAAERLTRVAELIGGNEKPLKEFTFATVNAGANLRKNKLETAIRHNYIPAIADRIEVKETYRYETPTGQASKRTTLIERVQGATRTTMQEFEYGVAYDELRLPRTITMPTCLQHNCSTAQGIATITNARTHGGLTSVQGFANLTYHPSGMVETVAHQSNPIATDRYAQAFGIARPSNIRFDGGTACPDVTAGPIDGSPTVCASSTGNSASIVPVSGLTYQWTISSGGTITSPANASSVTYTAPSNAGTATLTVTATSSCGATAQSTKTISVVASPTVTLTTLDPTIVRGATARLKVTFPGSGTRTIYWQAGGSEAGLASGAEIPVTPQTTTTYTILSVKDDSSGCIASANTSATVTVLPPAPSSVTATTQSATTIQVAWTAVAGATSYLVERAIVRDGAPQATFTVGGGALTYLDTVPGGTNAAGYVYYVRAIEGSQTSPRDDFDYAIASPMFDPGNAVGAGTPLRASYVMQLRSAVDAFRAAFGAGPMFQGAAPIVAGTPVRADVFTALVSALNDGRAQANAGYLPFSYSIAAPSPNQPVDYRHVAQLREALR